MIIEVRVFNTSMSMIYEACSQTCYQAYYELLTLQNTRKYGCPAYTSHVHIAKKMSLLPHYLTSALIAVCQSDNALDFQANWVQSSRDGNSHIGLYYLMGTAQSNLWNSISEQTTTDTAKKGN